MNSNNFTIKNLEQVLTPEDKTYCDNLFKHYEDLQEIARQTFIEGNRKLFQYNEANNNFFKSGADILALQMNNIASSMRDITIAMIKRMESYFESKYALENKFTSLLDATAYNLDDLLTNYEAVIANIINETGIDLSKQKP